MCKKTRSDFRKNGNGYAYHISWCKAHASKAKKPAKTTTKPAKTSAKPTRTRLPNYAKAWVATYKAELAKGVGHIKALIRATKAHGKLTTTQVRKALA